MSRTASVTIIAEGLTEVRFIKDVLAQDLALKNVFLKPVQISGPGQNGGNPRFVRVAKDIATQLKTRSDCYVTTMIDYYGIGSDWPGLANAQQRDLPDQIAAVLNKATIDTVAQKFPGLDVSRRFIPNFSIHEFEALLFSDPEILARHLHVSKEAVEKIIQNCGEPEKINNSVHTAPSKRLKSLYQSYKKTLTGLVIAKEISIDKMKSACPVFAEWLARLEALTD